MNKTVFTKSSSLKIITQAVTTALAISATATAITASIALAAQTTTPATEAKKTDSKKPDNVKIEAIEVTGERESSLRSNQNLPSSTASSLGLPAKELPVTVNVVDQQEMQSRGLRTALEAVVTAPGVTGGILPGSIPRYAVRGFTDNNVTLLRDGLKQNSIAQSSRPVDAFMLERIEVLKGPSSMMHGEGAVGGAINYVSRQPSFTKSADSFVSVGSFGQKRIGASLAGPLNDVVAYQATVGVIDDQGYTPRSRNQQHSVSAGVLANITPRLSAAVQYDLSAEKMASWFGLPVIYDAVVDVRTGVRSVGLANIAFHRLENARIDLSTRRFNYNLADSYTVGENQFLRGEIRYQLSDNIKFKNTSYMAMHYLKWRNSENYGWNPATQLVQRDLFHIYRDDTLVGNRTEFNFSNQLGRATLLVNAGIDVNNNDVFRGLRPAGALPAAIFNVPLSTPNVGSIPTQFENYVPSSAVDVKTRAVFVESMLETSPGVKWFAGLRHDRLFVDRRDFINVATSTIVRYRPTTGRVGVNWALTPQVNAYANYATSADPVNQIVSLFAAQRDLPLQRGKQLETGLRYASADSKLDATVALYKIVKTNLLINQIINGVTVPQTVGEQAATGFELAMSYAVTSELRIDANAGYTRSRFEDFREVNSGATFVRDGNVAPNVPTLSANLNANYRLDKQWRVSGGVRYVGERFANNANLITLPAFTVVDVAARWEKGPLNATLRVRNLTDKIYADWAINQGLQQRIAEPRSVELSLRYRF